MSFTQLIPFDPSKGGNTPNLCLANVCKGYGIPNKYGSAWEAWQHTQQHPDRNIPAGLAVPIYYSYTATIDGVTENYGHINVQLPDGRVWSDGNIYASIDDYTSRKLPKFVGWGESVNDFKIIGGETMPGIDKNAARILAAYIGGRDGRGGRPNALAGDTDADLEAHHVGVDPVTDIYTWFTSDESHAYIAALEAVYAKAAAGGESATVLKPGTYKVN